MNPVLLYFSFEVEVIEPIFLQFVRTYFRVTNDTKSSVNCFKFFLFHENFRYLLIEESLIRAD